MKSIFMFSFLQMAIRQIFVVHIPSALSDWELSEISRGCNFFTCYCKFVAPSTRSAACEILADWIACINYRSSGFFLKITCRSVVNNLHIDSLSTSFAIKSRFTTESLWISRISPKTVATSLSTGCLFITERC